MPSTFFGLNIGASGLSAFQASVTTTANNVSNTERENKLELIPLSRLRAQTIMKLLIENGLDEEILSYEGNGGMNPIAKWEDHENWWKNRRVEFIVTKKES